MSQKSKVKSQKKACPAKLLRSGGFTLLELIVSIGLFLIAVFIGIGAIANMFSVNNKSQSLVSVISNLNYSIEGMVRNIKYSTTYHCGTSGTLTLPNDCVASGDVSFAVSTTSSFYTVYRYNSTNSKIEISNNSSTWKAITGNDVKVNYARFYVGNSISGDAFQPYVLMVIRGYSGGKPSAQTSFDIQTFVSARALDI